VPLRNYSLTHVRTLQEKNTRALNNDGGRKVSQEKLPKLWGKATSWGGGQLPLCSYVAVSLLEFEINLAAVTGCEFVQTILHSKIRSFFLNYSLP